MKGASSGIKHRGFAGIRQGEGSVGPPCTVALSSVGKTGPPHQGGPGPRDGG